MTDFNQAASTWDENIERRKRSEDVAAAILAHAPITADTDLLEIGCGTGVLGLALRPHARSLVAADTAQEMLGIVEQKCQAEKRTQVRTLRLSGSADERFPVCDLVVSSMSMHHIEDLPGLFVRLLAALRPGGAVALADLDAEGGLFHPDPAGVFHNGFDHAELQKWLEAAGFIQVAFYPATRMRKVGSDGQERDFSIFLVVARKPAVH